MSVDHLKSEILHLVGSTNDEDVLNLVKEELLEYRRAESGYDVTDELDADSLENLRSLAAESPLENTISISDLKSKVDQWRSK